MSECSTTRCTRKHRKGSKCNFKNKGTNQPVRNSLATKPLRDHLKPTKYLIEDAEGEHPVNLAVKTVDTLAGLGVETEPDFDSKKGNWFLRHKPGR